MAKVGRTVVLMLVVVGRMVVMGGDRTLVRPYSGGVVLVESGGGRVDTLDLYIIISKRIQK